MDIGFVTSGLQFSGNSLATRAMGGAETALISMARCFAARGHNVKVFCECDDPGFHDGVQYNHRSQFITQSAVMPFDVLIASRWPTFLAGPSIAGLRVLWLHDMPADMKEMMPTLWQTDLLLGLSKFHIDKYVAAEEGLAPHFWQTRNGIDLELIKANIKPKVKNKVIFTSRPERGLHYLLGEILPRLISAEPSIKLHFCTYDLAGAMELPEDVKHIHDTCERLAAKYPSNAISMGNLPKAELYQQMSSAELLLYSTDFPEISCLSLMESQACGTPAVTTDAFAISETLCSDAGIKLQGFPRDKGYVDKFVVETLRLLNEPTLYAEKAAAGKKWIEDQRYTWTQIAEDWEKKFEEMFAVRMENKPAICQEMRRTHNLVAAEIMANKHGLTAEAEEAKQEISELSNRDYDPGDVVNRYAMAKDKFFKTMQLIDMHREQRPVTSFLEYNCDDVSLGIAFKARNRDARVVLLAEDAEIADRLLMYAEQSGVEVEVTQEVASGDQFDVVHIGNHICMQRDPQSFLDRVMSRYLVDNGTLSFSSVFGDERQRLGEPARYLWNFDAGDLNAMFVSEGNCFNLAFHDGRKRPVYEHIHGCWLGVLDKTNKLGKVPIADKFDRRTRPYQKLAVVMIAKDEEEWMPVSLGSIKNIADRICVVDTGSSDGTIEVARNYGAEIIEEPFDNFSSSRNTSIDMAKGADWLLQLDADEKLVYPHMARKYLHTTIFESFIIRQNQLILDSDTSAHDIPIRLWKNREHYRFTGLIHEHVENVLEKPFDDEVLPCLILPDVDIAHYGYTTENDRRWKCSRRNMALLVRDIEENAPKGRMLTWALVVRDFINVVKWRIEKQGRPEFGSYEHEMLQACVTVYHHYFADGVHKYSEIAHAAYQDALTILGACGLGYGEIAHPPFQMHFALGGGVGGFDPKKQVEPESVWFLSEEEFQNFLTNRGARLIVGMGINTMENCKEALTFKKPENLLSFPDVAGLLKRAVHEI